MSLPADKGRALIVRHLNVGRIRSNRSSATLALSIEHALSALSAQAVYALEPSAYRHSAVYFHDDAEPYISLALKLAREEETDAWFWPLAVRAWKPEMSRDEALRALCMAILRTEAGACAAVAMIQELQLKRASDSLFSALRRQDGAALLRAFGWSLPSPQPFFPTHTQSPAFGHDDESTSQCPSRWNGTLMRWVNHWGVDDPRSIWLAAVVLVTEKPARLLSNSLIERAQQLVSTARWPPQEPRVLQSSKLREVEREREPQDQQEQASVPKKISSGQIELHEIQGINHQGRSSELNLSSQLSSRGQFAHTLEKKTTDAPVHSTSESIEEHSLETVGGTRDEPQRLAASGLNTCPEPTGYAGLFFLIPLMSRLGIAAMLESNSPLIEIALPQRLLHFVAERLSIPESDPALTFLSTALPEQAAINCEYSIPQSWLRGLSHKGVWTIRRLKEADGGRILYDGSGRLAVGLWRGRMPQGLRELANGQTLKRGVAVPFKTDLSILYETWLVALRRWCRRYARIGLRNMVCRPGRVSVTPTHIDILFDHQQSDIRIRKAGLDINPGWVSWLGRVVTYHYLYGEQIYGK